MSEPFDKPLGRKADPPGAGGERFTIKGLRGPERSRQRVAAAARGSSLDEGDLEPRPQRIQSRPEQGLGPTECAGTTLPYHDFAWVSSPENRSAGGSPGMCGPPDRERRAFERTPR